MCNEVQHVGAIDFAHRGANMIVSPAFGRPIAETDCVNCGQCAAVCPTAAITIKKDLKGVWQALYAPNKRVVVQIAPAVRVAIGEEFGIAPGKNTIGKIYTALRMLGFDTVFDTSFSADLTVIEEANELLYKLENGEKKYPLGNSMPLFTSCCPAWVRFVETKYPELLPYVSTCKSPMEMFGAVLKEYYKPADEEAGLETVSVAVMPCVAKKYEAGDRESMFLAKYAKALLAVDDQKVFEVADLLLKNLSDAQRVDTAYWFVYEHPALTPVGSPNMEYLLANAVRFQKSVGEERVNEKIATAFDVKLTNMITGRDKQSGVEAIDAIEKEMEGYKFPSKPRLKMFAEIARAQRSGDIEKLLTTCEKNLPRIEHEHLLAAFFPLALTIKGKGDAGQQERMLALAKKLLAETTNDKFKFALGNFIPYALEKK